MVIVRSYSCGHSNAILVHSCSGSIFSSAWTILFKTPYFLRLHGLYYSDRGFWCTLLWAPTVALCWGAPLPLPPSLQCRHLGVSLPLWSPMGVDVSLDRLKPSKGGLYMSCGGNTGGCSILENYFVDMTGKCSATLWLLGGVGDRSSDRGPLNCVRLQIKEPHACVITALPWILLNRSVRFFFVGPGLLTLKCPPTCILSLVTVPIAVIRK